MLFGGNGQDRLLGGAGSDKIDAGDGDDFGFFVLGQQNAGDYDKYDGGNGYDLLVLRLTADEANDVDVQSKAVGLDNFISGNQYGAYHGQHYDSGLGLSVKNWENFAVEIDGVRHDDLDGLGWY